MLTGAGEWLWRPVANRETLQISAFADVQPARLRPVAAQRATSTPSTTTTAAGSCRPSLWIEPIGDWGEGEVHPARNPVRFREQRQHHRPVAAEGRARRGRVGLVRLSAVLVLDAAGAAAARAPSSTRAAARSASAAASPSNSSRDLFADPQKAAQATAQICTPAPGQIVSSRLFAYKERRSMRVVFDLDPGSESLFRAAADA